jgi:hypothetical protein
VSEGRPDGTDRHQDQDEGDREGDQEADGEEGRTARGLRAPIRVTKEMREEHNKTHCPYRSWCRYCVKGRGMNMSHKSKAHDEKDKEIEAVPRVSMDYFYMSQAGGDANEDPCLVMVDEETGEIYARAVGRNGVGEDGEMDWLVKDAVPPYSSRIYFSCFFIYHH